MHAAGEREHSVDVAGRTSRWAIAWSFTANLGAAAGRSTAGTGASERADHAEPGNAVQSSEQAADVQVGPVRRRFSFDVPAPPRDSLRLLRHLRDVLTGGGASCKVDEVAFVATALLKSGAAEQEISIRCNVMHQGSGVFVVTATVASSCSEDSCRAFLAFMKETKAAFTDSWRR